MRIGWRQYLKQRFQSSPRFAALGIEFSNDALHLCVLKEVSGQPLWVRQHSLSRSKNWPQLLADYVSEQQLTNTPTHISLAISQYQLLQVDKPQVEASEVHQALKWSIKELVQNSEQMVLDYIDLPTQVAGADKVQVVAMPEAEITALVKGIHYANLQLHSIGVEELVTANLLPDNDDAALTLLQENGQEVCLNIVKNHQLYFARRLKGYENLASFSDAELKLGLVDTLSVEVQRSMDYFESQLRQAPVKRILMALDTPHQSVLAEMLQQNTFKEVTLFTPELNKSPDLDFSQLSLSSLGAAMQAFEGRQ